MSIVSSYSTRAEQVGHLSCEPIGLCVKLNPVQPAESAQSNNSSIIQYLSLLRQAFTLLFVPLYIARFKCYCYQTISTSIRRGANPRSRPSCKLYGFLRSILHAEVAPREVTNKYGPLGLVR